MAGRFLEKWVAACAGLAQRSAGRLCRACFRLACAGLTRGRMIAAGAGAGRVRTAPRMGPTHRL